MENSERDGNTRPPDHLLRNLYGGQEATVRTGHGTTDWFQIGKGVHQGCILSLCLFNWSLPGGSEVKASACNAGDLASISELGRSLEKEMATHSSILAWRIPWREEPGRLQSMGSQRVGHDKESDMTKSRTRLSDFTSSLHFH